MTDENRTTTPPGAGKPAHHRAAAAALLAVLPPDALAALVAALAAWLRTLAEAASLLTPRAGKAARRTAERLAEQAGMTFWESGAVTYDTGRVARALALLWFDRDVDDVGKELVAHRAAIGEALDDLDAARALFEVLDAPAGGLCCHPSAPCDPCAAAGGAGLRERALRGELPHLVRVQGPPAPAAEAGDRAAMARAVLSALPRGRALAVLDAALVFVRALRALHDLRMAEEAALPAEGGARDECTRRARLAMHDAARACDAGPDAPARATLVAALLGAAPVDAAAACADFPVLEPRDLARAVNALLRLRRGLRMGGGA